MKRTEFTYKQLDRVLHSLGFSRRVIPDDPPAVRYEHRSGALISIPPQPEDDKVFGYHLVLTQATLEKYGIADPMVFEEKLRKAG